MYLKSCFLTLIAASTAMAAIDCGTQDLSPENDRIARDLETLELEARKNGTSLHNRTSININVYFHVVARDTSQDGGLRAPDEITKQLNVLNGAFARYDIRFKQAGLDNTVNARWANNCQEFEMKAALHKGTYADLNVYLTPTIRCIKEQPVSIFRQVNGVAYSFPNATVATTPLRVLDGINIRTDTIPGSDSNYNRGVALVHEVGHWLGLQHTFHEGCIGNGDNVDDTPPTELIPDISLKNGCRLMRDSCPGGAKAGDLVDNYMAYMQDACYDGARFTPGQVARMIGLWAEYRAEYQTDTGK